MVKTNCIICSCIATVPYLASNVYKKAVLKQTMVENTERVAQIHAEYALVNGNARLNEELILIESEEGKTA